MNVCLVLILMLYSFPQNPAPSPAKKPPEPETAKKGPRVAAKLLEVKRIYVDSFGDDPASKQLHDIVLNALAASEKFIVTENKDKADAVLKGSIGGLIHQEARGSSEGTAVNSAAIYESSHSTETLSEVSIAVRLVTSDGDVIWSATKESKGAKYKGPTADVADQVVKQLLGDLARLQSPSKDKEPPK
jgi:curli biogenesis system outer membrane secretion channel CsgG